MNKFKVPAQLKHACIFYKTLEKIEKEKYEKIQQLNVLCKRNYEKENIAVIKKTKKKKKIGVDVLLLCI